MSSGGRGLSKLGTALIIIFVIAVVALFAELFYVFWRRRVFRRRYPTVVHGGGVGGGDQLSQYSSDCSVSSAASSKDLLYFFCIRPRETESNPNGVVNTNAQPQMEVVDIDVLKLQGMYGPSRFLFTINEEEREDFELPCAEKDRNQSDTVINLEDGLNLTEQSPEELNGVAMEEEEGDRVGGFDATPFSTPCASPVYFTPSASPIHELVNAPSRAGAN